VGLDHAAQRNTAPHRLSLEGFLAIVERGMRRPPDLPNDNFDTGTATRPGIYRLNDETHAMLLDMLAKGNFNGASPEIRAELLEFVGHSDVVYAPKGKLKDRARVQAEREQLKMGAPPVVTPTADAPARPGHSSD
jgi:hypothetical protein